ncbi:MAG: DUF541 domain-containing protein [Dehalococcoidia bacterium]|nr:MAG: DUF541 domain-containing protein [Dehalococcoidia bacterium]
MKNTWWLIPCLVVVLALGAVGCARGGEVSIAPQQQTGIWVTGQGKAMAVPDIAELRLGVEVQADTVAEAQAQASEAMDKVQQALKDNGVAEKDIQTQQFSIYPVTKWIRDRDEQEIVGYRVTNIVVAKIREIDKVGVIVDAVAEAGGDFTRIQDISFDVDDKTPYYEEARAQGFEDAENKATQLAELAGVGLGKATFVSEGGAYLPVRMVDFISEASVPAGATPISPGELEITVYVQVIYEII